ncbi:MAG: dTDP-4-dehydrorhamnose reductase [Alphaproteobacteria bacterium]|nr:dTDP-4-dehydrorhamnose reductase [Alphaproteobacteria bacterium]
MRLAVFGAAGQLGCALNRVAAVRGIALVPFDRQNADITSARAALAAVERAQAAAVINAAAYTAVDKAEAEPDRAFAVNRDGAANLARAAEQCGIPMVHVSTDYVFDGAKQGAYVEDDPIAPLGAYGRSKAAGEDAVRSASARAVIVRTAWVYGLEGSNFVKTMLRLGAERDALRVVDDQRGCPTFADDLAAAVLALAGRLPDAAGQTFHLAGGGATTWFGFAQAVFAEAARFGVRAPRLAPIATVDYPTPARRPANSILDCSKAKRVLGVELSPWDDGLSRMLKAHLSGHG